MEPQFGFSDWKTMPQIASWVLLGLIAGLIARTILPGQERGGWFATLVLGIAGAVLGGWIARHFGHLPAPEASAWMPSLRSILSASVGAIIVLATWKWLKR